jgi:D-alanyl-D-alanine carboxypeptidase
MAGSVVDSRAVLGCILTVWVAWTPVRGDPASDAALRAAVNAAATTARAGALLDVSGCGIDTTVAAGVANRATGAPMPVDAPIRTGSVSKLLSAAAVHQLAAGNVLDLDRPASRYLRPGDAGGVPNRDATLRQLLMHTSGVPDYYDWRTTLFWDWTEPLTIERVLDEAARMEATHAPGTAYEYSNTGYHLAALAAARAAGRGFPSIVRDEVMVPLGLRDTVYNVAAPGGPIHGYGTPLNPWADTWRLAENTGADSGITATAGDLRRLLRALFLPGGEFESTGRAMMEPSVETGSPRQRAGAGAELRWSQDGQLLAGHTGNVAGYLTFAYAVPAWNATLVGHVNADDGDALAGLLRDAFRALQQSCRAAEKELNVADRRRRLSP